MRIESVRGRPGAALRGRGGCHGYDVAGGEPGVHRGLPSPTLTLVVTFDEPLAMRRPDGVLVRHPAVVGGLHTAPVTIVHRGRQAGIHVRLDPLSARDLLGRPAAALDDPCADVVDVLGPLGEELVGRVAEAVGWPARFAAVEDVLTRPLRTGRSGAAGRDVPDEIRYAWRRLLADRGTTRIAAVARATGWSERHLGQRFRAELGVGPKTAARMARFDAARRRIAARAASGRPLALADVAADGGYSDQGHLGREFAALAGCAPTSWVREEFGPRGLAAGIGNVRDTGPGDPRG